LEITRHLQYFNYHIKTEELLKVAFWRSLAVTMHVVMCQKRCRIETLLLTGS